MNKGKKLVYQVAEKLVISVGTQERHPSGAKARVHSAGLMRGLKPPPPSISSFSAACYAALIAILLLPGRTVFAADDLDKVLRKLDQAAQNFHSTSAGVEFESTQTDPVPDKQVQIGTVYYERKGGSFKMGVHFREENGKPVPKVMIFTGGVFKLYEQLIDQVTTSTKAGKYESYLALGFGASGTDLEQKWNIKYLGSETLEGIRTEKLELVAKDPDVLKLFPKVTIWIDPNRGVSLRQLFDEGQGQTRLCLYSNIKVNQPLPADAFTFKTDAQTTFVNR